MIEMLKRQIQAEQELLQHPLVFRRRSLTLTREKPTIILGTRHSGKSMYHVQTMYKLKESGIAKQRLIHVDFSNWRLKPLLGDPQHALLKAVYEIIPEASEKNPIWFFFDEIQELADWSHFIDDLYDKLPCTISATSNTRNIFSGDMEKIQGKYAIFEVFPCSFHEFLESRGLHLKEVPTEKEFPLVNMFFDRYLESGGFPEIMSIHDDAIREKRVQEYIDVITNVEIINRYNVHNPQAFSSMVYYLLNNITRPLTLEMIDAYLKSLNLVFTQDDIVRCLGWLYDAYLISAIQGMSKGTVLPITEGMRPYSIDHAFGEAICLNRNEMHKNLVKNIVFITLRRLTPSIYFYRCESGAEVDFISYFHDDTKLLIQVLDIETLSDPLFSQRVEHVFEAMDELDMQEAIIATTCIPDTPLIVRENKHISVRPVSKLVLEIEFTYSELPPYEFCETMQNFA